MRTTIDIGEIIYKAINTTAVKAEIDGDVYRNRKKINSGLQDIVIIPLNVSGKAVQEGFYNINCYCPDFIETKTPNITKLNSIVKAVLNELENYQNHNQFHFHLETMSQELMHDEDGMSFINIRVLINTINNV